MDKAVEKVIRNTFYIPEGELITVWRLPGWRECPLGDPELGVTNCPMGFDTGRWLPSNPPSWMRDKLGEEALSHCQRCQGEPRLTPEETQIWAKSFKILMRGNKC